MSSMIDGHVLDAVAGEAIERYKLVRLDGSTVRQVVKCRAGEVPIGVTRAAVASGGSIGVSLLHKPGTAVMIAESAITANSRVYTGYDGKVSANGLGKPLGYALSAASAAGDWVEVLIVPEMSPSTRPADQHVLFDDFFAFDTTEGPFDSTGDAGASGTTDVIDGKGGIMSVVCDGDDNDEMYLHTIVEALKFVVNKPLYVEARVAFTEGSTNKAAVLVAIQDGAGSNNLQDTEAGPPASYSGVSFWKVSGGLVLSAEYSDGATQTPIVLAPTASATLVSGTYKKYGILWVPTSSTLANVYLFLDDVLVGSAIGVTYASATEMDVLVGVKSDGSAEETALVDYIYAAQAR